MKLPTSVTVTNWSRQLLHPSVHLCMEVVPFCPITMHPHTALTVFCTRDGNMIRDPHKPAPHSLARDPCSTKISFVAFNKSTSLLTEKRLKSNFGRTDWDGLQARQPFQWNNVDKLNSDSLPCAGVDYVQAHSTMCRLVNWTQCFKIQLTPVLMSLLVKESSNNTASFSLPHKCLWSAQG